MGSRVRIPSPAPNFFMEISLLREGRLRRPSSFQAWCPHGVHGGDLRWWKSAPSPAARVGRLPVNLGATILHVANVAQNHCSRCIASAICGVEPALGLSRL